MGTPGSGGSTRSPAQPGGGVLRSPYPYASGAPDNMAGGGYGGPPSAAGGYGRPPPPRPGQSGPPQGQQGQQGQFSGRSSYSNAANSLVGKTVRVVGGAYNGYRGRVKNETSSHVQLELDAITKVVTISKEQVRVQDSSATTAAGGNRPGGYGGAASSQRPSDQRDLSYATRTPLHPSQTPMHPFGGATPSHPGMMTPLHAPYTPMHASTPMDDNYNMLQDDNSHGTYNSERGGGGHHHMSAPTPGLNAYTPSYTPAMTPSGYPEASAPTPGDMQGGLPGEQRRGKGGGGGGVSSS